MSMLPARMKTIQAKMKALECSYIFSHCKSMGIFSDAQGKQSLQSEVDFLVEFQTHQRLYRNVLISCKNEDLIKNEGA